MNKYKFVKQNHKNAMIAFMVFYVCIFIVATIAVVGQNKYYWVYAIFQVITLLICISVAKVFDSFGAYVSDDDIYYKVIKRRKVDINRIVGIKIIKAEGQVNLYWSSFVLKDKHSKILYSMICLSEIEAGMEKYPYGDIEFIRKYKKYIVFHTVYDEMLIEHLKRHKADMKIIA